jgi:polar amino acid transport system permease protein
VALTKRQRIRLVRGGLYGLFVVVVAVAAFLADWDAITRQFFQWDVARDMFPKVITIAAKNTVIYTVVSFVGGLVLGLVLALMKLSPIAPYRWVANAYIELFRGLPALLTIFFFAFAFPIAFGVRIPGGTIGAGVLGLVVVAGAYMAETIRAGIEAVPKGQREAARSLGMSSFWAMTSIIIPQAFRIIIPPLTNEFVLLIKDTSLLFVAGTQPVQEELTKFGRDELFSTSNGTPLIVVGLAYLAITFPLTRLVAQLEKRNRAAR